MPTNPFDDENGTSYALTGDEGQDPLCPDMHSKSLVGGNNR